MGYLSQNDKHPTDPPVKKALAEVNAVVEEGGNEDGLLRKCGVSL